MNTQNVGEDRPSGAYKLKLVVLQQRELQPEPDIDMLGDRFERYQRENNSFRKIVLRRCRTPALFGSEVVLSYDSRIGSSMQQLQHNEVWYSLYLN